ncbi:arginine--tRNA ligase [Dissulfurirhabdus thermomarina]|uniref:Arginine--tRNA ligase n=1 Tax=Dissulfurirhabdus thermomarina TaxID=1765737 RepID=A0A6N9TX73_DISTH|nr:arginine--tRNA ligase [Dissulfurirhabdus thermomarina]NDY43076.1 arginine--tRNA ligase [Dissulfurirhabdus thermomarina]NMX22389.1 arginine--tRNA ligase [Dissulfurirhabdus thermomarina]
MRQRTLHAIQSALREGARRGLWPDADPPGLQVTPPRHEAHGDYATNAALVLASAARRPPREIAADLARLLGGVSLFEKVEVAGPGFVNLFIAPSVWRENLREICRAGEAYGRTDAGGGRRVQVEFVSANPTGPLHVGHGRGAAVGDSLARILAAAGFRVEREYYINDVGNQMRTLGASVYYRYLELHGRPVDFPEDHYRGDYIREIAREMADRAGDRYLDTPLEACIDDFTALAVERISTGIRKDLEDFGVAFENWFSERTLHDSGLVTGTLELLEEKGHVYERDGALWFRSSAFGDEKDRVVRRANGILTYFAADIAYHRHKLERGYDLLVDIWGADHHGYVPRVKAAVEALGHPPEKVQVLLVQLVNLLEGGRPKAMSTRAGEFVTLREVLDDVGRDAARFIFLTRRSDSHLDFDLELARRRNQDNPVYYVQYAHARLSSVFHNAGERGIPVPGPDEADVHRLTAPEEAALLKLLDAFPRVVADSALALEPHRVTYYLTDLAGAVHNYYARHRFLDDDPALARARLLLAQALRQVLKKGLELLGVTAPETM